MNKVLISFIFISIATFAFADGDDKKKSASEVTPQTEISDNKSFTVSGLTACEVESDDEDGIEIFEETSTTVSKLIPLTEDLEDSEVIDFN